MPYSPTELSCLRSANQSACIRFLPPHGTPGFEVRYDPPSANPGPVLSLPALNPWEVRLTIDSMLTLSFTGNLAFKVTRSDARTNT